MNRQFDADNARFEDQNVLDAVPLDLDGDGTDESLAMDLNEDGIVDAVAVDVDGDGIVDAVAVDTDQNGVVDAIAVDVDGDGVLDAAAVDSNEDGIADAVVVDIDGDGAADVVELDAAGADELAAGYGYQDSGSGDWSYHAETFDGHVGGDGEGFSYYIDGDTCWYPE